MSEYSIDLAIDSLKQVRASEELRELSDDNPTIDRINFCINLFEEILKDVKK